MARGEGRGAGGRGGEGRKAGKPEAAEVDTSPPLMLTVSRLMNLIGGLSGPGYRLRLWASFLLTLLGKVLAVFSPLVLAAGINDIARGHAEGALPAFLGLAGFWAGLRYASTAAPQIRDAIFQPGLFERRAERRRLLAAAARHSAATDRAFRLQALEARATVSEMAPRLLLVIVPY